LKLTASLCLAVLLLLIGIFGIVQSLTFHYWESMVLPLIVSSIIFILASVQVGKELYHQKAKEGTTSKKSESTGGTGNEMRRFWLTLIWVLGLMSGIYLFGFKIAATVFTFAYLKWRGRSWLAAALFAAGVLAVLYGVFEIGLKAPLFKGLVFGAR
jgi:hypothetical protein